MQTLEEVGAVDYRTISKRPTGQGGHGCGIIPYKVGVDGTVKVTALLYKPEVKEATWRFAYGTKEGIETPGETAVREGSQELKGDTDLTIHLREEPLLIIPVKGDAERGGGVHLKFFWMAHELFGRTRTEDMTDADGVVMGPPQEWEVEMLMAEFFRQGRSTKAHQIALARLITVIANEVKAVCHRYAHVLCQFDPLMQSLERLKHNPYDWQSFDQAMNDHCNLLGYQWVFHKNDQGSRNHKGNGHKGRQTRRF
jgi:hypothetical protein